MSDDIVLLTPDDIEVLYAYGVACLAVVVSACFAQRLTTVRDKYRQALVDLQDERNRNRRQGHVIRRLTWDVRALNGYRPTAEEHLCLDTPVTFDHNTPEPWMMPDPDPMVHMAEPVNWPASLTTAVAALERDPAPGEDTAPFVIPRELQAAR